jgi:hypothetical protein
VDLIGQGEGFALRVFHLVLVLVQGGDCTFPIPLALHIARTLTNPTTSFLCSFSACVHPELVANCIRAYSVTQCNRRAGNQ